jgi:hypothetical protein
MLQPCPSDHPWFYHTNNIWRRVNVTKLLVMQCSRTSSCFQIFSSESCFRIPPFCVLYNFRKLKGGKFILNWKVASISRIEYTLRNLNSYLILSLYSIWTLTLRSSTFAVCVQYRLIILSFSLYCRYMFRPNWPPSGVQVVVMKGSAAHLNAVLLLLCRCIEFQVMC